MTVQELIAFCEKQGIEYFVYPYGVFVAGLTYAGEMDVTSYRVDQTKKVIRDITYNKYTVRFDPKTQEVTDWGKYSEAEKEFDIRQHPMWGK